MTTKKTKIENGAIRFDSELDFDFDDNFNIVDASKTKKKRQPIHDVVKGVSAGAKSRLKSASFYQNILKKALPESYSVFTDEIKKSKDVLSETYRESARILKPDLIRIGRQVDTLVPTEQKRIKKWTSKLNKPESSYNSNYSEESMQTQAILESQSQIFGGIQEQANLREARDRAENRVRDKIDSKRFASSVNILGNIDTGIQRLLGYTTSVNSSWQKKSLELQYRSFFVQAEQLKQTNKYNEVFKAYFEAIKENTALPDFVKITKTERFKQMSYDKIFAGLQQGIGNGIKRMGQRAKGYAYGAAGALGGMSMGLDQAEMIRDQMKLAKELGLDESLVMQGSQMGASLLTDLLGSKLGGQLKKAFPQGGRVRRASARAGSFALDPSGEVKKLQSSKFYKEMMAKDGKIGDIFRFIDTFVGDLKTPGQDLTLSKGSSAGKLEPHFFSNRAHVSLVEVIPGLLSRILQENTAIRMGSKKLGPLPIYNWRNGRFGNSTQFRDDAKKQLTSAAKSTSIDWRLDEAAKELTGTDLQGDQSLRIKKFIHKASANNETNFNSSSIFDNEHFKKLKVEDQKLIRDRVTQRQGSEEADFEVGSRISKIRESRSDQIKEGQKVLSKLIQQGHHQELFEAGYITENEDGGYSINIEKYEKLLQDHGITAKGSKPDLVRALIIPTNERGEQKYIGEREGYTYDRDKKRYVKTTTSDRNVKSNISPVGKGVLSKLLKLKTYRYQYRKGKHDDGGQQHQGYMAQDVHKHFGQSAAPGGRAIDMSHMTSMNTAAIQELANDKLKSRTVKDILESIDKRLSEMTTLGKVTAGIIPNSESGHLFGDTISLAGRYAKRLGVGFGKSTGLLGQVAKGGLSVGKTLGDFGKNVYDRNKDKAGNAIHTLIEDALNLSGSIYKQGKNVVTNLIPSALNSFKGLANNVMDRTKDFLNQPRDFYIPGLKEPILVGTLFSKGFYVDEHGKPILTIDDLKKVTGSIYKKSGELVVTASQLMNGLYDAQGTKLKYIATSLKSLALNAAGYVAGRLVGGLGKMKDLALSVIGKGGKTLSGFGNQVKGLFNRSTSHKTDTILTKIYTLLKKWDRKGTTGPQMSSGSSAGGSMGPVLDPGMSGPVSDLSAPGQGFAAMGSVLGGARSARDFLKSDKAKGMFSRLTSSRAAQRLGSIGGGRLGRLAGKLGGKLGFIGSLGSSLLGGSSTSHLNTSSIDSQHLSGTKTTGISGLFSRMMKSARPHVVPGQRAWNDTEGTGLRSGDWRTRLANMADKDAERKANMNNGQQGNQQNNPDSSGMLGKLGGIFSLLATGIGGLFGTAKELLMGGKIGNIAKNTLNVFSKGKGLVAGAAGKAGIKSLGKGVLGKILGKGTAKGLAKQIPGLGLLLGAGFGASRALKGDYTGAGLELLSTVPGFGLAATGALIAKDAMAAGNDSIYNNPTANQTGVKSSSSNQGILNKDSIHAINSEAESPKAGKGTTGRILDPTTSSSTSGKSVSAPKLATGGFADGSSGLQYIKAGPDVSFEGMNPSVMKNFLGMVQEYGVATGKTVQVNSAYRSIKDQVDAYNKNPSKAAKPGGSMHGFGLALDVNTEDLDALEEMGLMRKYGFTRPVGGETWHIEPAGIQANITLAKQNATIATQMTDASLLKGGGGVGATPGSQLGLRNRETQLALMNISSRPISPSQNTLDTINQALAPSAANDPGSIVNNKSISTRGSNVVPLFKPSTSSTNSSYSYSKNNQYPIDTAPKMPDEETVPDNQADSGETGIDSFAMDKDSILKTIDSSAKRVGVPGKDLQIVAAVESSLDPQAKAPTSSASGLFQFTNATWKQSLKENGSKYGLDNSVSPSNVKASSLLAGAYMKTNLQAVKNVTPNPGIVEAYLAHFLGAAGARKFLSSNPNAPGAYVFPGQAASNRDIFFNGNKPRTIGEIYSFLAAKLQNAAKTYGINGVSISKTFPGTGGGRMNALYPNTSTGNTYSSSTSVSSMASLTSGDYQQSSTNPIPKAPKTIENSAPVYTSRPSQNTVESGDSPLQSLLAVNNNALTIQQQSLDTMIEIRDLIKDFMGSVRSGSQTSPTPPSSTNQKPMSREVIKPIVDISRVRRQA